MKVKNSLPKKSLEWNFERKYNWIWILCHLTLDLLTLLHIVPGFELNFEKESKRESLSIRPTSVWTLGGFGQHNPTAPPCPTSAEPFEAQGQGSWMKPGQLISPASSPPGGRQRSDSESSTPEDSSANQNSPCSYHLQLSPHQSLFPFFCFLQQGQHQRRRKSESLHLNHWQKLTSGQHLTSEESGVNFWPQKSQRSTGTDPFGTGPAIEEFECQKKAGERTKRMGQSHAEVRLKR